MTLPVLPPEKEFYSIGEISRLTGVPPYILRYWESQFGLLRPSRRVSGHRKFTRKDVELIGRIRELLYDKRFTIEGAKKFLRQEAKRGLQQNSPDLGEAAPVIEVLKDVKKDVSDVLKMLDLADFTPVSR